MKIRSLTLKHIGVFEDETIVFPKKKEKNKAEIHILTGQNGTGKTTILQALAIKMLEVKPFIEFKSLISSTFKKNFYKRWNTGNNEHGDGSIIFDNGEEIKFNGFEAEGVNVFRDKKFNEIISERQQKIFQATLKEYSNNYIYNFVAFAYSGYRFIEHEENVETKDKPKYNPLEKALEFDKSFTQNDYTLNQWLAINSSKRALARESGDKKGIERFDKNIKNIELIIHEITGQTIKFETVYDRDLKIVANVEGKKLDFDLLPDGLRSLISWIGDLLMRMDALKWQNDLPVFEREFILFLDEIEVHLHPSWQRKVLPVVQKLFKNAQIFITTHSPFIVNSIDGAYIYELKLNAEGKCKVELPISISDTSKPIDEVLNEVYDIEPTQMYGEPRTIEIENFQKDVEKAYKKEADFDKKEFLIKAKTLAFRSTELRNNVQFELRQLSKSLAEDFSI
ncbi:MAG: AAA family ATPase [Flavobacterium sp.]|nr:AAA family ATPase [Flavobacterium sp.]